MPRPQKCRRVCALPEAGEFVPKGSTHGEEAVLLQVDEYEAIRLIDLFGLTQEECAAQMEVARTTVTSIYERARRKLADAIVNGKRLIIQGGSIRMCGGEPHGCGRCRCRRCAPPAAGKEEDPS